MHTEINGTDIYFDIEGTGLAVTDAGLADRPTLIALHGGPGFDHGYLRPGLSSLRNACQVVYVDLRGQGRSGRPPVDSCTFEQMADDVATLCRRVGVARPFVLGHSAGGFVALHLALRHPGLLRGLVLCNTTATMAPQHDDQPAPNLAERAGPEIAAIAQRFFGGDASPERVAEFSERVGPYYGGPTHMDVPLAMLRLSTLSLEVMRYFIEQLAATYDVRPELGQIDVPTLVISGRYDWVCTPAASRALARSIRGARLVEIAEAGHFTFAEEPKQFLAPLTSFLQAH
jgi:proline iminopeptidase